MVPCSSHEFRCFSTTPGEVPECSNHTLNHILNTAGQPRVSSYTWYRRFYCSFIKAMKLFFYRSSVSYVTHMCCGCVLVTFGVGLGTYDASRRRRLRVVTKSGFGREYDVSLSGLLVTVVRVFIVRLRGFSTPYS